eukprot:SAG31_NODE_314_length_17854_cov_3.932075_6_plen_364_part_00
MCDGTIDRSERVSDSVRQALKCLRKERTERALRAAGYSSEDIARAQARSVRFYGYESDNFAWLKKQIRTRRETAKQQHTEVQTQVHKAAEQNFGLAWAEAQANAAAFEKRARETVKRQEAARQAQLAALRRAARESELHMAVDVLKQLQPAHAELKMTSDKLRAEHIERYGAPAGSPDRAPCAWSPHPLSSRVAPSKDLPAHPALQIVGAVDELEKVNGLYQPNGHFHGWPRWAHEDGRLWIRRCSARHPKVDKWLIATAPTDVSRHGYLCHAEVLASCTAIDCADPTSERHSWHQAARMSGIISDGAADMQLLQVSESISESRSALETGVQEESKDVKIPDSRLNLDLEKSALSVSFHMENQ